ncbi:cytochrome P450 [Chloroflexi bacterium TSY]|nr:cytochrome P450 [Chloroflexi bacterium TSY]
MLPPQPTGKISRLAMQAWFQQGHILAALETFHRELGDVFRIPLPGFRPVVLVGPEANRFVFLTGREQLLWRAENDPVTKLLRHGVLVEDGEAHHQLRTVMAPVLHRRRLNEYIPMMVNCLDRVSATWIHNSSQNMLNEMRRATLLILIQTLFGVDFSPNLDRLWPAILRILAYISPGAWLVWPNIPRPGYRSAIQRMDDYLFQIIRARRNCPDLGDDLLSLLVATPGFSDGVIRDQLLTMLIAGHDTSTALLAWTLYLLGLHPKAMTRLQEEVDTMVGDQEPSDKNLRQLHYLEQVVKESLRLYPPIHLGQRLADTDFSFHNYHISAGTRVIYSIYLTHRDPNYWPDPAQFLPERFHAKTGQQQVPHTYVPFGGGARNCIGAGFGLVEAKVVLARLIQQFELTLIEKKVHPHMGATLEPHPGVIMQTRPRRQR